MIKSRPTPPACAWCATPLKPGTKICPECQAPVTTDEAEIPGLTSLPEGLRAVERNFNAHVAKLRQKRIVRVLGAG